MTATRGEAVRRPPRVLIRTFWLLHRFAYRITGGRFGLTRPATGARFGMLRLATVGRHSGRTRIAIVGYFEDGPNLVTLAMNGWGEAEPAWWLNLQAHPDAVVGLRDGTRAVRARAAAGEERERLWASFRDYPGWGDDLDGLAGQRPRDTAVVVLEPRAAAVEKREARAVVTAPAEAVLEARAIEGRTGTPDRPAVSTAPEATAHGGWAVALPAVRLRPRHIWVIPGLAAALTASQLSGSHGLGVLPPLVFGIAPELGALLAVRRPFGLGRLVPSAGWVRDLLRHPAPPIVLAVAGATGLVSPLWLVGGLAWLGNIVVGRALRGGPRTVNDLGSEGDLRRGLPGISGRPSTPGRPVSGGRSSAPSRSLA